MRGEFGEETGAALEGFTVAAVEADLRVAQMQMVASAGDGDLKKAALFFE